MDFMIEYIKDKSNGRKIYIWGAWGRGKRVEEWLRKESIQVEGYIDSKKQGMYNDKYILSPEKLLNENSGAFVIVTIVYHEEIQSFLENNGFEMNEDYLYLGATTTVANCIGYEDLMGNKIRGNIVKNNIQLAIGGQLAIGKNVVFEEKKQIEIIAFSAVHIGENVRIGNNAKLLCSDGSKIVLGNRVELGDNVKIICNDSSVVLLEDGVKIGDDTVILCKENSYIKLDEKMIVDHNVIMESTKDSEIYMGKKVHLCRYARVYSWRGGFIQIGKKTSLGQQLDLRSGTGTKFICGEDCMVSYQVRMRSHNGHTVIDKENKKVYKTREDVLIGNHVWVGTGATIMPGSKIGSGSIVGANSFLNREFSDNVMIVGTPARVIHGGVDWDRREALSYEQWERDKFIYD